VRIVLDEARCSSLGMCEELAPDVFEIGDDGALALLRATPDDARRAAVRAAVAACPTQALRLQE